MSASMPDVPAQIYTDFLAACTAPRAREPELFPAEQPLPGELEIQSRWFAGDFGREFVSTDGQRVEIVQFGWWNHAAGPDFLDCAVDIGGQRHRGSIEIDLVDRDWETHGHSANPAYDGTVLHLSLTSRGSGEFFVRTSQHRQVARVRLDAAVLTSGGGRPADARAGRCARSFGALSAARTGEILASAARYRIDKKSARWRRIAGIHGLDQALWQGLAEALGYSRNKLAMTVLAQRLPVRMLQERRGDAEALLFGVAGFLAGENFDHAEPDTRAWLRGMWDAWWKYRAAWSADPPHHPIRWNLSGMRPANHPQRRVAALAQAAAHWKALRRLCDPAVPFGEKPFRALLEGLRHPYWDFHYTTQSARAATRMALAGGPRVTDILANIVYPLLLPDQRVLWQAFCTLRAPLDNDRCRRAMLRLFPERTDSGDFGKFIWQQQALLQIYEDFCLQDATDCAGCPWPEQMHGHTAFHAASDPENGGLKF